MPDYWLDADVFIESRKGPYDFQIAPGFWELLRQKAGEGAIASTITVYDEILKGTDELVDWVKQQQDDFGMFLEPDDEVQAAFREIANYVQANYDIDKARTFLGGADPWLIAHAKAKGGIVVTFEAASRSIGARKVKIPNVCLEFDVVVKNTYGMLKELGANFVLSS
jgi:hypothetical protein